MSSRVPTMALRVGAVEVRLRRVCRLVGAVGEMTEVDGVLVVAVAALGHDRGHDGKKGDQQAAREDQPRPPWATPVRGRRDHGAKLPIDKPDGYPSYGEVVFRTPRGCTAALSGIVCSAGRRDGQSTLRTS